MAIDTTRVVRVRETITPSIGDSRDFGTVLYMQNAPSTTNTTPLAERQRNLGVRLYTNASQVSDDWGESSSTATAAATFFAQRPYPGRFAVGSRFTSGEAGRIVGRYTGSRAALQAASDFSFFGAAATIDLSSTTSNTNLASVLQNGINGITGVTGVTVSADGTFPPGGSNGDVTITFTLPTALASASGININAGASGAGAEVLGLAGADKYARPIVAETTVAAALNRFASENGQWYWLVPGDDVADSDLDEIADWVAADQQPRIMLFDTNEAAALTANETTSQLATVFADQNERVGGFWSATEDGKALSAAARFSSVDFNQPNAALTIVHKALPGTAPDDALTPTQQDELERKNVSYYATVKGVPMVLGGKTFKGATADSAVYLDARLFADWLAETTEHRVVRYMSSVGSVGLTERGVATIEGIVKGVCDQAVLNGGFAPGESLSAALTGSVVAITGSRGFDGVLRSGYLTYVGPITELNRAARTTPPIYIWGVYRTPIHTTHIEIAI